MAFIWVGFAVSISIQSAGCVQGDVLVKTSVNVM